MNRTTEQTLLSLLPTQNSALPPSLVSLAGSLLAQSRHRASTLKAEEEIARTYACAHIACDRLKISLNLPPIDPRPPIPPRIYKRLYGHLDKILPNTTISSTPAGTPRSAAKARGSTATAASSPAATTTPTRTRQRDAAVAMTNGSSARVPSRPTPGKEQSLARFRSSSSEQRRTGGGGGSSSVAPPPRYPRWVRPVARVVCKELGAGRLVASVIAGMDTIAAEQTRGPTAAADCWAAANITALLAAVVFYVMRAADAASREGQEEDVNGGGDLNLAAGAGLTSEEYKAVEKRLLDAMAQAREEVVPPAADDEESNPWESWQTLRPRAFKKALVEVTDRGWLASDWFRGVVDVVGHGGGGDQDRRSGEEEEDGEHGGMDVGLRRRADTMFQARYDYLSEARRRDYRAWKARMLRKVEALGKREPADVEMMEVGA